MEKYYVHYGDAHFDPEKFDEIQNRTFMNKPLGGFWGSPINAGFGWKDWNDEEQFAECDQNNCIAFSLKPGANIYEIHTEHDWDELVKKYPGPMGKMPFPGMIDVNFERMADDYDGIELFLSDDGRLYHAMYGWDCDSILIFHPDVVKEVDKSIAFGDNIGDSDIADDDEER